MNCFWPVSFSLALFAVSLSLSVSLSEPLCCKLFKDSQRAAAAAQEEGVGSLQMPLDVHNKIIKMGNNAQIERCVTVCSYAIGQSWAGLNVNKRADLFHWNCKSCELDAFIFVSPSDFLSSILNSAESTCFWSVRFSRNVHWMIEWCLWLTCPGCHDAIRSNVI